MSTIGSNPTGVVGKIAGTLMNLIHAGQYSRIIGYTLLRHLDPSAEVSILDVGCGGGKTVEIMSRLLPAARVCGIDHSPDMVHLAERVNAAGLAGGSVEIDRADVRDLPYPENAFDAVTAFDTINFWPDLEASIAEVRRVLKDGGIFLIVNGYPADGTKWYDFVQFKSDAEYRAFLADQDFKEVETLIEKHTIIICARN